MSKSAHKRAARSRNKKLAEQRLRNNGNLEYFEDATARMTHNAHMGRMLREVNTLNACANRPIRDRRLDRHPKHRGASSAYFLGADG